MTVPDADKIRRDLPPDLDRAEREQLVALAKRLQADVPVPVPGFRGDLRRRLTGTGDRRAKAIAPHVARRLAVGYTASGVFLLAVATLGLAGVGPFAAA